MKKYIYTIVAATAMLASCSQDAELNEVIDNQSKAITEIGASTSAGTRAVVSSSDNTKVNWESGDQLGVFGEGATGVVAYTLDGTAGSTSGTFKNASSTITTVQAMMYPYQSTATWAESKLTCEIPPVQTATVGSFDKAAAIMYSIGSSTDATLDYAVNFLKVSVTEDNVRSITISSSAALSGMMEITSSGVTSASSGAVNSVTLVASGSNPEDCLATGVYYIAVKKGNIADPTISYTYINNTDHTAIVKTKAGSGSLTFADGKNVKTIKAPSSWDGATDRTAKQLWEHGPFFATVNVGETTETGNSAKYVWGIDGSGYAGAYWGTTYENGQIPAIYDVATGYWSSAWRMPTSDEFSSLISSSNCNASYSGTPSPGYTFQSIAYSTNSIFLPAQSSSSAGNYWSATPGNVYYMANNLYYNGTSEEPSIHQCEHSDNLFVRAVLR